MAAQNISIQIRKFWYPAETVPAEVLVPLLSIIGEMRDAFSNMASPTPANRKVKTYLRKVHGEAEERRVF